MTDADEAKTMEGYVYKGGKSHRILAIGGGKVLRTCNRDGCCRGKERFERYPLLPCNHHALLRLCTCRIRDRQCSACKQVFIAVREFWYRIADPHAKQDAAKEGRTMSHTVKVHWYYQDKLEYCPECGEGLRCCPSCQDRKYCQRCITDYCPACMTKREIVHA